MARQRYINTDFWRDDYIENLDPLERYLFIYCLTNPQTNIAGVYKVSIKRMAFETGLDRDMLVKMLARFQKDCKIAFIDGYIVIKNFIKHQKVNPKIEIGIAECLKDIPESVEKWLNNTLSKPIDSLSKPLNYLNVNTNDNTNVNDNRKKETIKKAKFVKPSIEQIKQHLSDKQIVGIDAEKFYYYYESRGWTIGKSAMKSWEAAIQTWIRNIKKDTKPVRDMSNEIWD